MQGIRNTLAFYISKVSLILFFFVLFLGCSFYASAQQNFYDNDLLTTQFHKSNREALRNLLPEKTVAIIFSNPERNRSNDVNFQFSQDPDLYYLTGITQPHSAIIIFKNEITTPNGNTNEILFIQERDEKAETWNGRRLEIDEAKNVSGFNTVLLNTLFSDNLPDFSEYENIFIKYPTDIDVADGKKNSLNFMVRTLKDEVSNKGMNSKSAPLLSLLASLRQIKQPEEIKLMQKAVDVTVLGFEEAIRAIEPGITEFQAQAIIEFYFKNNGSEYPGYPSISGGAENSCVLHYITNRKQLSDGDLILMDMGAEYHGYTADVTRTVPVNGKFTKEQKIIYDLVLKAQQAGIDKSVSGNSFYDPNTAAIKVVTEGLIDLGILKKDESSRKYFNHGTSHYLGLQVHDSGLYGKLEPGMVITVEPGIYIPEGSECDPKWWNIGVRIEDDVLITDKEPVVMSGGLVRSTAGIEKLMEEKSLFNSIK